MIEDVPDLKRTVLKVNRAILVGAEGLVSLNLADRVFLVEDDLVSPLERDHTILADWIERRKCNGVE